MEPSAAGDALGAARMVQRSSSTWVHCEGFEYQRGGAESSCRTATVFPFRDAMSRKKSQMIYELKRITPPTGEASQEDRRAKEKHLSHVT